MTGWCYLNFTFDWKINEPRQVANIMINKFNVNAITSTTPITLSKSMKLYCLYTDTRSLMNKNKRDEIELMLTVDKIDILGISESWANEDIEDAEISFPGYTVFRRDRGNGNKRGG